VHEILASGASLGRSTADSTCDIQIDDARMSRSHSRIARAASGWQLVDLGSRNGAFVDGARSPERTSLRDGAVVRIGDTLMVFRASAPIDDGGADADAFPGVSPAVVKVRRRLHALASGSGHVLVLGETGVGKERVASSLHRGPGRFQATNCAELRREFMRSELFGHARGAFSGAVQAEPGLVALAGDGVLFLDEIGELPLELQGDLLRFLEDGSYRPLGSSELKHSKARVVAATNVDIEVAVAENKFRRDLLARLRASNQPLELPPLRDRREDIPRWARRFFEEAGASVTDEPWTAGALECLLLYPWVENLRELRSLARALLEEGIPAPYQADHLPARIRSYRAALRSHPDPPPRDEPAPSPRPPTKAEVEAALLETSGRVRAAAALLGIDRRKLYRLFEQYGIELATARQAIQQEDPDE
jgi:two-component system NtrC family response regulator